MPVDTPEKTNEAVTEPASGEVKEVLAVGQDVKPVKDEAQTVQSPNAEPEKPDKVTDSEAYKGLQRKLQKAQDELAEARKGTVQYEALRAEVGELKATNKLILETQKVSNDLIAGKITEAQANERYADIEKKQQEASMQTRFSTFAKAVKDAGLDVNDPELRKWTERYATPEAATEDLPLYVAKVKGKAKPEPEAKEGTAPENKDSQSELDKAKADAKYWRDVAEGKLAADAGGPSASGLNIDSMSPAQKIQYGLNKKKP